MKHEIKLSVIIIVAFMSGFFVELGVLAAKYLA